MPAGKPQPGIVFAGTGLSKLRPVFHCTKKTNPLGLVLIVVGEDGFEPSKRNAADLQSVPFGHSGTPPYLVIGLEPVDGLGTLR